MSVQDLIIRLGMLRLSGIRHAIRFAAVVTPLIPLVRSLQIPGDYIFHDGASYFQHYYYYKMFFLYMRIV
jgi:hypothetical protein